MTTEQVWLGATAAAAVVLALVALVLAQRARRRAARAEALSVTLAGRLDALAAPAADAPRAPSPVSSATEDADAYVITHLDPADRLADPAPEPVAAPVDGRLFVDLLARESVVKAAAWSHGLRRALSPDSRNRIRFEVRQQTRRAGRDRRAEMKQALREYRSRERADVRAADVRGADVRGAGEDVA
ncbi:hypothetical protein [Nocardioides sp. SYSU D00065]|uniref:hypothetical protein n=1 Tax=Nocardioides sp. SYSU D00065 TaxID=2817378 RepID=UPI001B30FF79|nr:hypothetical protein [Nocardioides sp. SYSU D00065]